MRHCSSGRSSSPTRPTASWCSSNSPRSGSRPTCCLEPMRRDSGPAIAAGAAFARVPRQGGRRAGARGRSRRARHGSLSRRLPRGAGGGGERTYRDLRRQAGTCRDRIWLYQPRRGGVRRGSRGRQIRREAGSADRRAIRQGRLSLEQRQLHVPRRRSARRIPQVRCGERADGLGVRHQGRARSRLRHARPRRLSARRSRSPSTMR